MSIIKNQKISGYLFISAGGIFFVSAVMGVVIAKKPVFYSFFGVGAAFVAIGAAMLRKAKRE